jgi:hypothetical protein
LYTRPAYAATASCGDLSCSQEIHNIRAPGGFLDMHLNLQFNDLSPGPGNVHKPKWKFINQSGNLSAKVEIYQPKWKFISQSGNLSAKYLSAKYLHYASCRTLEQQGREDDEGKGQRLAVDAKSDLQLFRLTEGLFY